MASSNSTLSQPLDGAFAYYGTLVHCISPSEIEFLDDTIIVVDRKGKIAFVHPQWEWDEFGDDPSEAIPKLLNQPDGQISVTILSEEQFIIPSFIDTHVHAPQFSMRGLGQGMQILEWLDQITFPHEAMFEDVQYAERVYKSCVDMGLRQGVTTACYFGSLHTPATKILVDVCLEKGQRAFIGKTCMDHPENNPSYYREATTEALQGTRELIEYCRTVDEKGHYVRPIITPRFAISCTQESLRGLGEIAKEHVAAYGQDNGVLNQTHYCEADQEVEATLKQYPDFKCEADLYDHHGLLDHNSVLAHCTKLSDEDHAKIKERNCGIAHCPVSNTTVGGGFMPAPIRRLLSEGITKLGLGTDSGGGFSCSIMDAMRQALIVGNAREMLSGGKEKRLSLEEVFYMATFGGAKTLGISDRVGSFEVGKLFDACLVDMQDCDMDETSNFYGVHSPTEGKTMRQTWQTWLMTGDDRNLRIVWVGGQQKKNTFRRQRW